ncbi:MAG: SEC-C domain-containing protein, partial [Deltaproteobacteria bacterium]|nr:SEC-C domain-containing protein [Deltaproteobacteria bacterium]
YEKELQLLAKKRTEALKKLTEAYRPYLEAVYAKAKADYEEVATQLCFGEGGIDGGVLKRYSKAREKYEGTLSEYDKVVGPSWGEDEQRVYEVLKEEYDTLLEGWVGANGDVAFAERLRPGQARYEKALADFERAVLKAAGYQSDGSVDVAAQYETARQAYEEAEQEYQEADRQYEEKRRPYEEELAKAERTYEERRRERVKLVEELREQLEKAPDHYRQRYDEVLEKYYKTCLEERGKVVAAGGLHILGTERHEARRIDNQLRGRSGRQGDPGSSRFYLSLEDDLMRIFGAERIQKIMDRLGMEEGVPIEHRLVTRAIENAQKRVEAHNFDIRKHLLEYDDVMNKQREVIYQQRRDVLAGENLKEEVLGMAEELAEDTAGSFASKEVFPEEWDWKGFDDALFRQFNFRLQFSEEEKAEFTPEKLQDVAVQRVRDLYEEKEKAFTPPAMRYLEKVVRLQTIDSLWKDHLLAMDHLKEGIGLRGYGQKNPLQEYQREGFEMFEEMTGKIQEDVVQKLFTVQIARQEDVERIAPRRRPQQVMMSHGRQVQQQAQPVTVRRDGVKVGRNDPCPCGSGKKYKKCHGTG